MWIVGLCKGGGHDVVVVRFTGHRHVSVVTNPKTGHGGEGRGERGREGEVWGGGERRERERMCVTCAPARGRW